MMIRKLFFDANIILDMLDSDRENIKNVRTLVHIALMKGIELYTSCDILSNVYYVGRKKLEKHLLVEEMLRILEIFEIVPIDKPIAKNALLANKTKLPLDFEDILQHECAMVRECDFIVTNDKKFVTGEIKALSLDEALKRL